MTEFLLQQLQLSVALLTGPGEVSFSCGISHLTIMESKNHRQREDSGELLRWGGLRVCLQ